MTIDGVLLITAALLLVSVFASKASSRFGVPALLLFVAIGMLAGSEGPGGIWFDDIRLSQHIGIVALAFILFSGGLDTAWRDVRPVLLPGLSLATIGVLVSAAIVGWFAHHLLGFGAAEAVPRRHRLLDRRRGRVLRSPIDVPDGSPVLGRQFVEIGFPLETTVLLVYRGNVFFAPNGATVFEPHDRLMIFTSKRSVDEVRRIIG